MDRAVTVVAGDEHIQRLAMQHLASAVRPSSVRALGEFITTLTLVIVTWAAGALVLYPRMTAQSSWWALPWAAVCALLAVWLVRTFVVMHDAGHGALARLRWLNLLIGHACSVFVFTPMLHWSALHWNHHRTTGNLDQQDGIGDTYTMTVRQYLALPVWERRLYRVFRHPATFLLIVPSVIFFLDHRLPVMWFPWANKLRKATKSEFLNVVLLNICYVAIAWWVLRHWTLVAPWLITYGLATILMVTLSVIFFYTQHQFDETYYARDEHWSFFESGIRGSMTLRVPFGIMEWAVGYINFHSVHHLKPRIPLYRLPKRITSSSGSDSRSRSADSEICQSPLPARCGTSTRDVSSALLTLSGHRSSVRERELEIPTRSARSAARR